MKYPYLCFLIIVLFYACEEVVEVDLPETESRLVIDAVLRVDTSEVFVPIEIKVAETSSFFEENTPASLESAVIIYGLPVEGAPELFEFSFRSNLTESAPGSGIYVPDPSFSTDQRIRSSTLQEGFVFQFILEHQGRRYLAVTPYRPSVAIDNLEQGEEILFNDDDKELKITFTDIPIEKNYYVFDFDFGEFLAVDDQFTDGQQFEFSYFHQNPLEVGQEVEVSILGADLEFYNYMDLLMEQTMDDGGVFETPASTVRGNIFDITGLDNINIFDNVERPEVFPLGYFAVVQTFKQRITIE
ncbi:MAG: DUF4249 family protein [Bacteroidota bacterium]